MKKNSIRRNSFILAIMITMCLSLVGCGNQESQHVSRQSLSNDEEISNVSEVLHSEESFPESVESSIGEAVSELSEVTSFEAPPTATESASIEETAPAVSLIMVGDILLHTPVEKSALQADGSYDFTAIFSETKELIQEADLALVNQEVIIGGEELGISGYPAFNAPYAIGDALVDAGFDVICHGTNHALDKGSRGLTNCLAFWEENYPDIAVLGIHDSQESQDSIYIYEQDGIRIAILNYTYGTNGIPLPSDMPYAVDMLEQEQVVEDIAKAEELADFTIVCPHWGTEYELGVSSMQKKWTQIFLENGVDLVLGTHPHVIEPIEWVTDEETGREMLVYYSLGNFVNWTSGTGTGVANRMVGGMAQVTIEMSEDGETFIADYGVEPLVCHLQEGTNGVTVYPLEEYTEELGSSNEIGKQDNNFSLEYCEALCRKVWGEYFN